MCCSAQKEPRLSWLSDKGAIWALAVLSKRAEYDSHDLTGTALFKKGSIWTLAVLSKKAEYDSHDLTGTAMLEKDSKKAPLLNSGCRKFQTAYVLSTPAKGVQNTTAT